jgi:hypothetical protein
LPRGRPGPGSRGRRRAQIDRPGPRRFWEREFQARLSHDGNRHGTKAKTGVAADVPVACLSARFGLCRPEKCGCSWRPEYAVR